ncbi:hypothetical protein LJC46_04135 [Desulfovibrio sp. OttesenSCG-928-G15]|nr:hypothetical protein [Desulfovibrio sp. OttesenSCG-928-G15]
MKKQDQAISRPVELLVGMREIAAFLRVSHTSVRDMLKNGAPILRDEVGTLRAEKAELWEWKKCHCEKTDLP